MTATTISLVAWVMLSSVSSIGSGRFSHLLQVNEGSKPNYVIDFESSMQLPVAIGDSFRAKIVADCYPARIANDPPFAHIDRRSWVCTAKSVEVYSLKTGNVLLK